MLFLIRVAGFVVFVVGVVSLVMVSLKPPLNRVAGLMLLLIRVAGFAVFLDSGC